MKNGSYTVALLVALAGGIWLGYWRSPCCAGDVWKYVYGQKTDTAQAVHFKDDESVRFLALNMYFHRGETNSDIGRKAITAVVFNRLKDHAHYWGPKSVKRIITFGYKSGRSDCAFTWNCDGKSDIPANPQRFAQDFALAQKWYVEYQRGTFVDPTSGATWFLYRRSEYPTKWPVLIQTGTFGEYTFYKF